MGADEIGKARAVAVARSIFGGQDASIKPRASVERGPDGPLEVRLTEEELAGLLGEVAADAVRQSHMHRGDAGLPMRYRLKGRGDAEP